MTGGFATFRPSIDWIAGVLRDGLAAGLTDRCSPSRIRFFDGFFIPTDT